MSMNIHLRGIDERTMQLLKNEARHKDTSVNSLILALIKKGLGLTQEREKAVFHDLDNLAGTWSKSEAKKFLKTIADFEQIDKELWK